MPLDRTVESRQEIIGWERRRDQQRTSRLDLNLGADKIFNTFLYLILFPLYSKYWTFFLIVLEKQ